MLSSVYISCCSCLLICFAYIHSNSISAMHEQCKQTSSDWNPSFKWVGLFTKIMDTCKDPTMVLWLGHHGLNGYPLRQPQIKLVMYCFVLGDSSRSVWHPTGNCQSPKTISSFVAYSSFTYTAILTKHQPIDHCSFFGGQLSGILTLMTAAYQPYHNHYD